MLFKYISPILFSLSFLMTTGCSKENKSKAIEDQKIFDQIFPELIQEILYDTRKRYLPPPPPPAVFSDKDLEEFKQNHKNYLKSTEFAPLYVIITDTINPFSKMNLKNMYNEIDELKFIDTTNQKRAFKIDFTNINLSDDYYLKYESTLKKPIFELIMEDLNKERHKRNHVGVLNLTRIYYDKDKETGFFGIGTYCGELCGSYYYVIIKKNNDKWAIYKKIATGVV